MRTREGMVVRAKGWLRGKQPKLGPQQEARPVTPHAAGEDTISELEELLGMTCPTVYRALARGRPVPPDRPSSSATPATGANWSTGGRRAGRTSCSGPTTPSRRLVSTPAASRLPMVDRGAHDASRAVAGYTVFSGAPFALNLSSVLRQAIWHTTAPGHPRRSRWCNRSRTYGVAGGRHTVSPTRPAGNGPVLAHRTESAAQVRCQDPRSAPTGFEPDGCTPAGGLVVDEAIRFG